LIDERRGHAMIVKWPLAGIGATTVGASVSDMLMAILYAPVVQFERVSKLEDKKV
jgi:hypothetical protein